MKNKARDYTRKTLRRLDTLSCNECACPKCNKKFIGWDEETLISKICHIEAAEANGPRYNIKMSDDDRRSFDNLILLCDECHSIVDNPANTNTYTVALLKKWKSDHDSKAMESLTQNPSFLLSAVLALIKVDYADIQTETDDLLVYDIDEKIKQNGIIRNKSLIEEYKNFFSKINAIYDELDRQGTFNKERLLRLTHYLYLKVKGKYTKNPNDTKYLIQDADDIFDEVQEALIQKVVDQKISIEDDTEYGISLIMVDSFIKCKILEKPV